MGILHFHTINVDTNDVDLRIIQTNLYDLIESVISSARSDESHLTSFIVSHILDSSNIRMSKNAVESIQA